MRGLKCGWLVMLLWLSQPAYAQTIVKYVHTDALGSVVALTDSEGSVVEGRREYEPYGYQMTPVIEDGPGYTGHVQDAATGLTYMQQRYYDPQSGVFLSVDPVAANPDSGANFNRYKYAANNPYRFTDPDGQLELEKLPEVIKGVAIGVADRLFADFHDSSPNPMVAAYPGEHSLAEFCGCDYQSPFSAPASNEEQLGRDLAPAVSLGLAAVTRNPGRIAGRTETVQRAMSRAELAATESSGLIRGGRSGTHYVSNAVNSNALRARQRLALPQTPEVRVTLEVPFGRFSSPSRVEPNFSMPGGGMERSASGDIPARILRIDEY
jgi:RHS repeat-associated protein